MMPKIATVAAVVFALAAVVLCDLLLAKHVTGSSGAAWFDAGCSDQPGSGNCAAVLASPYSYWPPKHPNESPERPHVPVAFLGMLYYSVLAVWLIGVGRPSVSRRWLHAAPLGLVALGLAGSAYFTYIMLSELNEWCPWCLVTHGLNLGIAVCLVMMFPRKRAAAVPALESVAEAAETASAAHPSLRLAAITGLAIVLVVLGESQMYGRANLAKSLTGYQQAFEQCNQYLARYRGDAGALVDEWQKEPVRDLAIDSDDPVRIGDPSSTKALVLVVFSDFECPSCRKVASFVHDEVEPLFGGNLMTVFKHFPLNARCNPATQTLMHARACDAARMAEAARVVGGSDAFWSVHDYLFQNQDRMKTGALTPEEVAQHANLNVAAWQAAIASEAASERIKRDAMEGRQAGLTGTPALYLAGRRVDNVARDSIQFWDRIAADYWKSRGMERPESTKLARRGAVTPGSPGRPTGP